MPAIGLAFLLVSGVGWAEPPAPGLTTLASGRFVLVERQEVYRPRLDTAVERAIASLNFAIRPIARYRLRPAVYETVCPDLRLLLTDETFTVQCDGGEAETRHLDGSDGTLVDDGDTYRISIRLAGSSVAVTYTGTRGGQANTYTFDRAGDLMLHGSIFSASLPAPLRWTLPYRRVEPAP